MDQTSSLDGHRDLAGALSVSDAYQFIDMATQGWIVFSWLISGKRLVGSFIGDFFR